MTTTRMIAEWLESRDELAKIERSEHPDLVDRHGRVWVWKSKDLYTHDGCLAWTEDMVMNSGLGLPSPKLAGNPNYDLCEICKSDWK
jgi:hypothetical protein